MSNPIWFAYVPVAFMAALLWVRRLTSHEPRNWSRVSLFASVIFAIHFFLPFYILGLFELIFKRPAIHAVPATILCLVTFCIGWLIWGRHVGQLQEAGGISDLAATPESPPLTPTRTRSLDRVARAVLALTLVVFAVVAAMIAFGFPRGFESMTYHLPIGVYFFQTGSLKVWSHAFMHTLPANESIWYGYWLALGLERVTALSNLVFLVPLSAGLYEIGRALGVNRAAQSLTLAGFLTIPLVAFSALECGADIGGIAWLACALALALTNTTGQISRIALTGICLGLAYGFKILHLVGTVIIALWLLYSDVRRIAIQSPTVSGRQSILATAVKTQAILILSFLAMAGYWLARNWVEFGNPFYPVQLPLIGSIIGWSIAPDLAFAGSTLPQFQWVRSSAEWLVYPWLEWHNIEQNFKHSSGFGPFVASVVLIAVLGALVTLRSRIDPSAYKRAFLLLGGSAILFVWGMHVFREPRYMMGAFVFWFPLAGWFLSSIPNRWAPLQFGVATVSVLTMLGVLFTKQAAEFGDHFILAKQKHRWEYYEYPRELDTLPPNSVIMNLADPTWNYALFGANLSLRIINFIAAKQLVVAARSMLDYYTPVEFKFNASVLKTAGITHLFALDSTPIEIDGCVALNEIGRFDRQPSNGNPVHPARVLYAVVYPTQPCSSSDEMRSVSADGLK